jgi:hypothetical protein
VPMPSAAAISPGTVTWTPTSTSPSVFTATALFTRAAAC